MGRIESPSSINTYKQCPRKYYYHYIEKRPTKPAIPLIIGSVVHAVLEDFFRLTPDRLEENTYQATFQAVLLDSLKRHWQESQKDWQTLHISEAQQEFYFDEANQMVQNWYEDFLTHLHKKLETMTFQEALRELTPTREVELISAPYKLRGYIDAIYETGQGIQLIDYKTSNSVKLSEEYKRQLAFYALLYSELKGRRPHKVTLHFLRFNEHLSLPVTEEMLQLAKQECEVMQLNTQTQEKMDYPRKPGPLCKWSSGQCDFYELCYDSRGLLRDE